MELKNSYFTPDIEDIRVGYECEIFTTKEIEKFDKGEWKPYVVRANIIEVILKATDLSKTIRVPYLTKEQIEAEGWDENGSKGEYRLEWGSVKKGDLFFVFVSISREKSQLYGGRCNDINTFRYICKLLGI